MRKDTRLSLLFCTASDEKSEYIHRKPLKKYILSCSGDAMDVDPPGSAVSSGDQVTSQEPEPEWMGRLRSVDTILGGGKTVALHQEFLIRNNHTDLQILKNTKVGVAGRCS